jgi:leucyl/phenylalanyl-tRNA--protein transferase
MIAEPNKTYVFPSLDETTPEGLVAVGGDLSRGRLLAAYRQGIFPWYSQGQPILWWSPDPRTVLYTGKVKISRSLRKTLRHCNLKITMDSAFEDVINACAACRRNESETWITDDMRFAYCDLYRQGDAHSVEVWHNNTLVGGLYGVALGSIFFGESMFSRLSNTSKVALVGLDWQLQQMNYRLIDCQIPSKHLFSLGAESINRKQFLTELENGVQQNGQRESWQLDISAAILA